MGVTKRGGPIAKPFCGIGVGVGFGFGCGWGIGLGVGGRSTFWPASRAASDLCVGWRAGKGEGSIEPLLRWCWWPPVAHAMAVVTASVRTTGSWLWWRLVDKAGRVVATPRCRATPGLCGPARGAHRSRPQGFLVGFFFVAVPLTRCTGSWLCLSCWSIVCGEFPACLSLSQFSSSVRPSFAPPP